MLVVHYGTARPCPCFQQSTNRGIFDVTRSQAPWIFPTLQHMPITAQQKPSAQTAARMEDGKTVSVKCQGLGNGLARENPCAPGKACEGAGWGANPGWPLHAYIQHTPEFWPVESRHPTMEMMAPNPPQGSEGYSALLALPLTEIKTHHFGGDCSGPG